MTRKRYEQDIQSMDIKNAKSQKMMTFATIFTNIQIPVMKQQQTNRLRTQQNPKRRHITKTMKKHEDHIHMDTR